MNSPYEGTLAREHVRHISTCACNASWHAITQGTLAGKHARHIDT